MPRDYRIETTVEPKKLLQVFALAGTDWAGELDAQKFAEVEVKSLVDFILAGNPGRAFYVESKSGEIDAMCSITQHRALFKDASISSISTIPDPASFGVKNITAIKLSYVFVRKEKRGQGLMSSLLSKAIEYTEKEILKKELARSSDKKDSFKSMVMDGNEIDHSLVQHYLGKKYVWYLYSAIGTTYSRFGFKGYPLEGYKLSPCLAKGETQGFVEKLLSPGASETAGKKLRLLDGDKKSDRDLIVQILQGKELDLLTELNKNIFHSELSGGRRSSSSLTNLSSALSSAKLGSHSELTAITEKFRENTIGDEKESGGSSCGLANRRKSAVLQESCAKIAILPDLRQFEARYGNIQASARKANDKERIEYTKVYGAILTNEFQKKSFYVLWMPVTSSLLHVVGMGELKLDLFGAMADPAGYTNPIGRRRSSSFTGINEMGGFNFQDLDLLLHAALYVNKRIGGEHRDLSVYVNLHDLPDSIPGVVLHDFFMNYLPNNYLATATKVDEDDADEPVTFISNYDSIRLLPMLKKFGTSNPDFELDWIANSVINWG